MIGSEASFGQRAARATAWTVTGLGLGATGALGAFNQAEQETTLGTHEVNISPTHDDQVTFEIDGLGKIRLPSDGKFGLGARIIVENSPNMRGNLQKDLLIAANPEGEIDKLEDVTQDMIVDSILKGAAFGSIALGGLYYARRKPKSETLNVAKDTSPRQLGTLVFGVTAGLITFQLQADGNLSQTDDISWVKITDKVPALQRVDNKNLQALEVEQGLATDAFIDGANSMVDGYNKARDFYDELNERVVTVVDQLHQSSEDQTVVLQLTDRHDNILVDKIWRSIGDAAGATVVLSTGDDTSSGSPVEAFSLNSINKTFEGYEKAIAAGNHDHGSFVTDYLAERGWTILDGEPKEVAGIRFLGDSDPRQSSVTVRMHEDEHAIELLGDQLAETACEDGNVSTIAVHDADAGTSAAEKGCVKLVLAGHDHAQKGPDIVTSKDGHQAVTLTSGTSGGAAFAVAISTKLKRDAQATLVTYEGNAPIGLQIVTLETSGEITIDPYWQMPGTETELAKPAPNTKPIAKSDKPNTPETTGLQR